MLGIHGLVFRQRKCNEPSTTGAKFAFAIASSAIDPEVTNGQLFAMQGQGGQLCPVRSDSIDGDPPAAALQRSTAIFLPSPEKLLELGTKPDTCFSNYLRLDDKYCLVVNPIHSRICCR